MKLALLGVTPQALVLAARAAELGHEIAIAYDAATDRTALLDAFPRIRVRSDWESLLGEREVDAVIVAGPRLPEDEPADVREQCDDQLRKLIQAAVPLVVIPPVCEAIVGFELEMIRRDVKAVVVPALTEPLHAALDDLANWLSPKAGVLGNIELIRMERALPLRRRLDVLSAFVGDAEVLRRLVGPLRRLTASGGKAEGEEKPSLANVVVQAEGESGLAVRWSPVAPENFSGARLTVEGGEGRLTLHMPLDGNWELAGPGIERSYERLDSAVVFEELEQAISQESAPRITWLDACRAVEAAEAIDRSLGRGRTIELYNEEHSEESSFKGIMAAGGCLILLATLAIFIGAGVLTVLLPPAKGSGGSYWGWLQACLLVPLGLFLAVQLLSFGLSRHLRNKHRDSTDAEKSAKSL